MRDMAAERPKGHEGNLVETPPIIPGTLRDREERAKQAVRGQRRFFSRIAHSRLGKAVGLAAGAATLVGVFGFGNGGGNSGQPQPENTPTPRPTASETFNPTQSALRIIDAKDDNPYDAEKIDANMGSTLNLSFTEGSRGQVWPRIREATENTDGQDGQPYNVVTASDIKEISGVAVDIKPGSELKVSNFITVPGYDADGGLGNTEGRWLALDARLQDGSEKLVYISLSRQTDPNWTIKPSAESHQVPLRSTSELSEDLNKVEVIK